PKLQGERIAVRAPEPVTLNGEVRSSRPLPPVIDAASWTHAGGDAAHSGGHRAGPAAPRLAWRVSAGVAPGALLPPGAPVADGGRIYVRDGASGVMAFDAATGRRVWKADLALEGEDGDIGYGGGLALDAGRLFATTGFGETLALDPATGAITWRTRGDAPYRSAPVASQGQVASVSAANGVIGLDAASGAVAWRSEGLSTRTGNLGRGAPAAAPGAVLIPFGSGELSVIRIPSGVQVWSINLGASAGGEGLSAFSDLTSGPVLAGAMVIAGTAGGQFVGIDGRIGRQAWARRFGSLSPAWVAGDTVFVMSSEPRVMRLNVEDGATMWAQTLDGYDDMEDRTDPITYAGPVLAGGKVWVTSSDGRLLSFDGVTGAPADAIDMPDGSVTGPIAAGGTIYVLTDAGDLLAYR
ncbi:MAG: outer membrane protein assembly factor BamB, partial [Paracoccaceae bacterium]